MTGAACDLLGSKDCSKDGSRSSRSRFEVGSFCHDGFCKQLERSILFSRLLARKTEWLGLPILALNDLGRRVNLKNAAFTSMPSMLLSLSVSSAAGDRETPETG
jgi:hypothetical protein